MKKFYLLDTNTSSYIIKGNIPAVQENLLHVPMEQVCISVITEAELLYGLARRPEARNLKIAVHEFLLRVDILTWDSNAACTYADIRASLEAKGKVCGAMDMMIAAQALAINATLVTNDKAFKQIKHLILEDWTKHKLK